MKGESPTRIGKISTQRLNFILAVCAILISAVSFYATYLQAISAEKQVKAMTLPLIQFSHGNFNEERNKKAITLTLKNAGQGPAVIKNVLFKYQNGEYASVSEFFDACCKVEWDDYQSKTHEITEIYDGTDFSRPLSDAIIPGQTEYEFQAIYYGEVTEQLWEKLNEERWHLELEVCYCSLLDECYTTERTGVVAEVAKCPG